jgi:hypothetical protein
MDLVHDFANTLDQRSFRDHGVRRTGADTFAEPAGLAGWLRARGLLTDSDEVTARDRADAVAVRAALRAALARPAGPVPLPGTFTVRAGPAGPELVPAGAGATTRAVGEVVAAAARLAATDRWRRLKMCPAPDCHWVFEDRSRSAGGRWCSSERCGNRAKTRAYRRRSRAADAATAVEPR